MQVYERVILSQIELHYSFLRARRVLRGTYVCTYCANIEVLAKTETLGNPPRIDAELPGSTVLGGKLVCTLIYPPLKMSSSATSISQYVVLETSTGLGLL